MQGMVQDLLILLSFPRLGSLIQEWGQTWEEVVLLIPNKAEYIGPGEEATAKQSLQIWGWENWIRFLALPLVGCVALRKLLDLSESQCFHLKDGNNT